MTHTSYKRTKTTNFKPRVPKPEGEGCLLSFIIFAGIALLITLIVAIGYLLF